MESGVFELEGVVQHYYWGGHTFIPHLLGIRNPDGKPYAELWMGAHPKAPALAELDGGSVPLDQLIAADPRKVLGPSSEFLNGRLPYLFKVLDVAKMLSIQAHPARAQAQAGFARENAAGIPLQGESRNYRDDNHKPEIGVALTDFWLLHSFRPLSEIGEWMKTVPELHAVLPEFGEQLGRAGTNAIAQSALLRELYSRIMTLPQERIDELAGSLVSRLQKTRQTLTKNDPEYWVMHAVEHFPLPDGHYDRGLFSVYLLNLVHLRPGQGTFQPAGVLHAYLDGVNVELMANSDNVLRGGLTPKHVDVPELLQVLKFEAGKPTILDGVVTRHGERIYRTDAEEFELARIDLAPGAKYSGHAAQGADSLLLLEGSATIVSAGRNLPLHRGSIVFVPFDQHYVLESTDAEAVFFRASVPKP
jgi:mannose-6-phosphate isomerase